MFPRLDLYYADPEQPLTTAGEELDDVNHDLPEVWTIWRIVYQVYESRLAVVEPRVVEPASASSKIGAPCFFARGEIESRICSYCNAWYMATWLNSYTMFIPGKILTRHKSMLRLSPFSPRVENVQRSQ